MVKSKPYERCALDCKFLVDGDCTYANKHVHAIAVDFDRTLFELDGWRGHDYVGEAIDGSADALNELIDMGFKIIIYTTRNQRDIIEKGLVGASIPFDYINENPNQPPEINPRKLLADFYVDDRAVRFTDWKSVIKEIKERIKKDDLFYLKDK